jgi:hypothetical protein
MRLFLWTISVICIAVGVLVLGADTRLLILERAMPLR